MRTFFMIKDLTKGNIFKNILIFSLPIIIGLLIQQLYNLADSIIVGQYIGEDGIAAIGTTGSINILIIALGNGITGGFAIIVGQKFGAKDEAGVKKSIGHAISLSLIICLILTIVALSISKQLLTLLQVPSSIYQWSYDYITWIYIGIFSIVGYNLISSILRALGNSLVPLIFLILASIINVGLDILFVGVFRLGVGSAALATVISQTISGVLSFIYAFKKYPLIRVSFRDFILEKKESFDQLKNGLPMGFQYSLISLGIIVVQTTINSFATPGDSSIIAAFATAGRIEGFFIVPFWGIGAAMTAYMAQNYGAKNLNGIKMGMRIAVILTVLVTIFASTTLFFLGRYGVYIFISEPSENILYYLDLYFKITPLFYLFLGFILTFRSVLQGMGDSWFNLSVGLLELASRALIIYFFAEQFGYYIVYFAGTLTWVVTALAFIIRFFYFLWKKQKFDFFISKPHPDLPPPEVAYDIPLTY